MSTQIYFALYLLGIALIVFFTSIKGVIKGNKYKKSRVLLRPIIYLLLGTSLVFYSLTFINSLFALILYISAILVVTLIGVGFGVVLGAGVEVYYGMDGELYYRRSPLIYALWFSAFLIRIILEVLFFADPFIYFLADAMLMFTSGLLVGEAYHVIRIANRKEFRWWR